jgi:hypothetical protein
MAVASSSWEHYHITYRYINPRFFPQRNQRMIQRNRQLHSRAWGSGEHTTRAEICGRISGRTNEPRRPKIQCHSLAINREVVGTERQFPV